MAALRDLSISLRAKTAEFTKDMSKANGSLTKFGKTGSKASKGVSSGLSDIRGNIGKLLPSIGQLFGAFAFAALINGIRNSVKEIINLADRIQDLNQITGLSTDSIQEWQFVAKIAGVEVEAVTKATEGFIRKITGLNEESGKAHDQMKLLGVEFKTAGGAIKNADVIMDDTLYALAEMDNALERNAIGSQLFGGAWKQLAPILGNGRKGIEELREEARELGVVMSGATLQSIDALRKETVKLDSQWDIFKRNLLLAVIPSLTELVTGVNDLLVKIKEVKKEQEDAPVSLDNWTDSWRQMQTFLGNIDPAEKWPVVLNKISGGLLYQEKALKLVEKAQSNIDFKEDLRATRKERIAAEEEAATAAQLEAAEAAKEAGEEQLGLIGHIEKKMKDLNDAKRIAFDPLVIRELNIEIVNLGKELERLNDIAATIEIAGPDILGSFADEVMAGIDTDIPTRVVEPITASYSEFLSAEEAFNLRLSELAKERENIWRAPGAALADALSEQMSILSSSLMEGADSFEEFANNLKKQTKSIIGALIAQGVAGMVSGALKDWSTKVPFGYLIAPAAAALAGGLAKTAFNSLIPKFAKGGIVSGPTFGMLGEYPGAGTNPEVIAPLSKLKEMIGGGEGTVRFVIEGSQLVGILEGWNKKQIYF